MKKLIISNLKMTQSPSETKKYLISLLPRIAQSKNQIVICPPFTSLFVAEKIADGFDIELGAQNISEKEDGSFTGEISPHMLSDMHISYVIIGHSERRKNFQETDKKINKKLKTALKNGFKIILCIGENEVERLSGKTASVLKKQIEEATSGLYENELSSIIIAYEPVWAIGSGSPATEKQISECMSVVRASVSELFSKECAKNIKIVYGGSVNVNNASKIAKCEGVDGLLVGAASLDTEKFAKICKI